MSSPRAEAVAEVLVLRTCKQYRNVWVTADVHLTRSAHRSHGQPAGIARADGAVRKSATTGYRRRAPKGSSNKVGHTGQPIPFTLAGQPSGLIH